MLDCRTFRLHEGAAGAAVEGIGEEECCWSAAIRVDGPPELTAEWRDEGLFLRRADVGGARAAATPCAPGQPHLPALSFLLLVPPNTIGLTVADVQAEFAEELCGRVAPVAAKEFRAGRTGGGAGDPGIYGGEAAFPATIVDVDDRPHTEFGFRGLKLVTFRVYVAQYAPPAERCRLLRWASFRLVAGTQGAPEKYGAELLAAARQRPNAGDIINL